MFRRFFSLLLVPLMLANQGLCLAHVHHAADVAESDGHAVQPHLHFGGHGHDAGHSHERHASMHPGSADHDITRPSLAAVVDHDTDAMYFADTVTLGRAGNSPGAFPAKHISIPATLGMANQVSGLLGLGLLTWPAAVFDAACPIYLRTHALRI